MPKPSLPRISRFCGASMLAPLPTSLRGKVYGHFTLYNASIVAATLGLCTLQSVHIDAPNVAVFSLILVAVNVLAWIIFAKRDWRNFRLKPGKQRVW